MRDEEKGTTLLMCPLGLSVTGTHARCYKRRPRGQIGKGPKCDLKGAMTRLFRALRSASKATYNALVVEDEQPARLHAVPGGA